MVMSHPRLAALPKPPFFFFLFSLGHYKKISTSHNTNYHCMVSLKSSMQLVFKYTAVTL